MGKASNTANTSRNSRAAPTAIAVATAAVTQAFKSNGNVLGEIKEKIIANFW